MQLPPTQPTPQEVLAKFGKRNPSCLNPPQSSFKQIILRSLDKALSISIFQNEKRNDLTIEYIRMK